MTKHRVFSGGRAVCNPSNFEGNVQPMLTLEPSTMDDLSMNHEKLGEQSMRGRLISTIRWERDKYEIGM
jgi:hypothetical protein